MPANREAIRSIVASTNLLLLIAGTSANNGADLNTNGCDAVTFVFMQNGVGAGTNKLQHADDNGSGAAGAYADCLPADFITDTALTTTTTTVRKIAYVGSKKWVRFVSTFASGTPVVGVAATLSRLNDEPIDPLMA